MICELYVVFEVVSAYGTVGLSLGTPTVRLPTLFLTASDLRLAGKLFVIWSLPSII